MTAPTQLATVPAVEPRERIEALRREGLSLSAIADTLNRDGLPASGGQSWNIARVHRVLKPRRLTDTPRQAPLPDVLPIALPPPALIRHPEIRSAAETYTSTLREIADGGGGQRRLRGKLAAARVQLLAAVDADVDDWQEQLDAEIVARRAACANAIRVLAHEHVRLTTAVALACWLRRFPHASWHPPLTTGELQGLTTPHKLAHVAAALREIDAGAVPHSTG